MPRFVGRRPRGLWFDVVAVAVLLIVVLVVLELTGVIQLIGASGVVAPVRPAGGGG